MKNKILFILAGLLIVLTLQNISAIGITPGRTTLDFEPNLNKEVSFSIINSEHKAMSVLLYAKGELKEYIKLSQESVVFSSQEDSKFSTYTVALPKELEPGLHTVEIVALEVPEDAELDGTVIGATVAVVTQLYVYVPYPGKYLDLDLNILEANPGYSTMFFVPVTSRGKLNIEKAKAVIKIYSGADQIDELETEEIGVLVGERKELVGTWDTNVDIGRYKAKVVLTYDGKEATIEKEFNVGEAKLEIEAITVKDFTLGEIAKFNIVVRNKWEGEIKNSYVQMIVYGLEKNILADFKSPSYDVPALSRTEMVSYWDTEGIKKGTYDGKLILKYEEKRDEKNVKIKVDDYSIEVIGFTGRVIVEKQERFNLNNLLIIAVVFLILANIVWFLIVKRLKKKK